MLEGFSIIVCISCQHCDLSSTQVALRWHNSVRTYSIKHANRSLLVNDKRLTLAVLLEATLLQTRGLVFIASSLQWHCTIGVLIFAKVVRDFYKICTREVPRLSRSADDFLFHCSMLLLRHLKLVDGHLHDTIVRFLRCTTSRDRQANSDVLSV